VLQSVVLAGVFFTVMSYLVVLGFEGSGASLSASEAPLHVLAGSLRLGGLGTAINVGILLSFFSCTLAAINSSARLLFSMARHGLIPDALGQAHVQNRTPHVAVALTALVTFSIPSAVYIAGVSAFDCQAYFATLCSFGFIVVYILTCVAAPAYLSSIQKRASSRTRSSVQAPARPTIAADDAISMPRAIAYAAGGVAFMLLPLVGTIGIPGSDLLPPPEGGLLLVATFAAYITAGLGWLGLRRMRRPRLISDLPPAVENLDLQS
jgi:amino acid transporter